jgi:copper homeostasis protein (lipoprotein)
MNLKPLFASLVLVPLLSIALPGCRREQSAAPSQAAAARPADMARAGVEPNPAGFDDKEFAGTFRGTLPCADCPGIDETLRLQPDGSFTLTDVYRERPQGTRTIAGSWTMEADGTRVRLDPNTKSEPDRVYAVASSARLEMLDKDGHAPSGALPYHLSRSP